MTKAPQTRTRHEPLTTVAQIDALERGPRVYRRPVDGSGLCIEVHPNGTKSWRYRYVIDGVQKMIGLGVYGHGNGRVSLKEARRMHDAESELVRQGIDPSAKRKQDSADRRKVHKTHFQDIAAAWVATQGAWAHGTREKYVAILENHAYPWLGKIPVSNITRKQLVSTLDRLNKLGKLEAGRKLAQLYRRIFHYAQAKLELIEHTPATDLAEAIHTYQSRHHAAITDPQAAGALMRAIDGFAGTLTVKCALRLSALTFLRPGELRRAEWSEIDLDAAMWRLPANKMKGGKTAHVVPLSTQAVAVLRELMPVTGTGRYVFPSARSMQRPMSENAVNGALRRLGYAKDEMTAHGFRGMASTLLHEQGWRAEVIERQLAHEERNQVKAAYNHAAYMADRVQMMQQWADFLDAQRDGSKVTPIHRRFA